MKEEFFKKPIKGEQEIISGLGELHGDLHAHSSLSRVPGEIRKLYPLLKVVRYIYKHIGPKKKDGHGLEYFAFTEHVGTPTEPYRGLEKESGRKLLGQKHQIDKINKERRFPGLTFLAGAEVNLYPGGYLDLEDKILSKLDIVIASWHLTPLGVKTSEKISTYRQAARNPYIDIFAHPELKWHPLGIRLGPQVWPHLIAAAKKYGKAIEINVNQIEVHPLSFLKLLAQSGVWVSFGSDTHDHPKIKQNKPLSQKDWGEFTKVIALMKKAGIKKSQILNCLPLADLRRWRQERIKRFKKSK